MNTFKLSVFAALALAVTACSGGSGLGGVLGPIGQTPQCDTGTQEQLASPFPGQTRVSTNTSQIVIVADGNANALYNTYSQWNMTLTDPFGNSISGGSLSLVPLPNGPHPYGSDFYYASNLSQPLAPGTTYNVSIWQSGVNCTAVPLQSFST